MQAREWLDHLLLHENDAPYLNSEQAIVLAAITQSDHKRPFCWKVLPVQVKLKFTCS